MSERYIAWFEDGQAAVFDGETRIAFTGTSESAEKVARILNEQADTIADLRRELEECRAKTIEECYKHVIDLAYEDSEEDGGLDRETQLQILGVASELKRWAKRSE